MDAVVFYPRCVINIPSCFSFSKQLKLGKPIYSFKDGSLASTPRNGMFELSVSSVNSDGSGKGRPPRKRSTPGRTKKEDESKDAQTSDGRPHKSSNQEEIIALFRRIRSSISMGDSTSTQKRKANFSGEKSATNSVLGILQQSQKHVKETTTNGEGHKILKQKQGDTEDQKTPNDAEHKAIELKSARPPSNFIKRSPITPRGKAIEVNHEPTTATPSSYELKLPRINEMKLPELKELAKSRGIKGYSKLKKGELLELLKS